MCDKDLLLAVWKIQNVFDNFQAKEILRNLVRVLIWILSKWIFTQYMIHVYIFTFRLRINNLKVMNIHKVFISFNNFSVRLDILPGAHASYGSWAPTPVVF